MRCRRRGRASSARGGCRGRAVFGRAGSTGPGPALGGSAKSGLEALGRRGSRRCWRRRPGRRPSAIGAGDRRRRRGRGRRGEGGEAGRRGRGRRRGARRPGRRRRRRGRGGPAAAAAAARWSSAASGARPRASPPRRGRRGGRRCPGGRRGRGRGGRRRRRGRRPRRGRGRGGCRRRPRAWRRGRRRPRGSVRSSGRRRAAGAGRRAVSAARAPPRRRGGEAGRAPQGRQEPRLSSPCSASRCPSHGGDHRPKRRALTRSRGAAAVSRRGGVAGKAAGASAARARVPRRRRLGYKAGPARSSGNGPRRRAYLHSARGLRRCLPAARRFASAAPPRRRAPRPRAGDRHDRHLPQAQPQPDLAARAGGRDRFPPTGPTSPVRRGPSTSAAAATSGCACRAAPR